MAGSRLPERTLALIGRRFGRLTVQARVLGGTAGQSAKWQAICDCGNTVTARSDHLRSGAVRSCGCLATELAVERAILAGHRNATHGATVGVTRGKRVDRAYKAWADAIQRCENPKNPRFVHYGERGITMAPEWRHDFPAFLAHIGPHPGPGFSLDRIDNDRGYEPGNVRWATATQQRHNRRTKTRWGGAGAAVRVPPTTRRPEGGLPSVALGPPRTPPGYPPWPTTPHGTSAWPKARSEKT
jgi:hypothetical protein